MKIRIIDQYLYFQGIEKQVCMNTFLNKGMDLNSKAAERISQTAFYLQVNEPWDRVTQIKPYQRN